MKVQQKLALRLIRTKLNLLSLISKKKAGEEAFRLFCTPYSEYKGKESELLKNGEKLEFMLNGMKVSGYRCNHPSPQRVLLLHGFGSSCHNFHTYADQFVKNGFEVLAFDAPAHGISEGKTVNAVEYAEMIREIITLYGPIQHFLAHSFGGMAVSLALEDTPHDENTKIVLIAPATETTSAIENAFYMLGIRNASIRNSLDEIIYKISGKDTSWFSIRRAVKNIKASVLWIHDEDDDVTPHSDALKVFDDAPSNVRFLFTKGLGHRKIYRDADVQKAVFEFIYPFFTLHSHGEKL